MNFKKINQYFFLIASVIAILDGAFKLQPGMESVKLIVLVLSGLAVGVLTQDRLESYLVAGISVVIAGIVFTQLLGQNLVMFSGVLQMVINFVVFLSASLLVVGLRLVADIIAGDDEVLSSKHSEKNSVHHSFYDHFEKVWGYVILIAVALTFIIILSETFFDTSDYAVFLTVVEMTITALFITDLVILYRHANGFVDFLKRYVFDIIAAIPVVGVLQVFKIVRVVRFARVLRNTSKLAKISRANRTAKYFSDESSFNKVNKSGDKKKSSVKKINHKKNK